jgi:hypothetical protein
LGEGAEEADCAEPLIGALINQTNLYFPRTISAIFVPDLRPADNEVIAIRNDLEQNPGICGIARTVWNMPNRPAAVALALTALTGANRSADPAKVEAALEGLFSPSATYIGRENIPGTPESEMVAFRRVEFNVLRTEINDQDRVPNLRVIPTAVPAEVQEWVERVTLVERLRETRVFYGFDRLKQEGRLLEGMPETAMSQLFRYPPRDPQEQWLPAVEVFGEGIYIELKDAAIRNWQALNREWLQERLSDAFVNRLQDVPQVLKPLTVPTKSWASRYLLTHSLAHILINQLVFECGYSTASLRERLYVSDDVDAPMAAMLIYTAAGDSEGTLGGLVRLGRPDRLPQVLARALSRASWCSADPVCSENLGGGGARLVNLAGCHSCLLLPETSCETINHALDRATVVGTPDNRETGWLTPLIPQGYTLA